MRLCCGVVQCVAVFYISFFFKCLGILCASMYWSTLNFCPLCWYSDKEELKVKEETGATIRCFPFEQPEGTKTCLMTGSPAEEVAIFAKSY